MFKSLYLILFVGLFAISIQSKAADGLKLGIATSVGSDSNVYEEDGSDDGTFYSIAPSITFAHSGFEGSASIKYKDWSEAENSNQARSTTTGGALKYDGKHGTFNSSTEGTFEHIRHRKANGDNGTEGIGDSKMTFGIKQGLAWDMGQFAFGVNGSAKLVNAEGLGSDSPPNVIEAQNYSEDKNELKLEFDLAIKFNEMVSLKVKPSVSQTTYDETPGRLTNGDGGIAALGTDKEFIDNSIAVELPISYNNFSIEPGFGFGSRSDQAFGAEDNSSVSFGFAAKLKFPNANNLVFETGYAASTTEYDQWTESVASGTREDDTSTFKLGASIEFTPNFSFALNHESITKESNRVSTSSNYDRDITSGTLTATF